MTFEEAEKELKDWHKEEKKEGGRLRKQSAAF